MHRAPAMPWPAASSMTMTSAPQHLAHDDAVRVVALDGPGQVGQRDPPSPSMSAGRATQLSTWLWRTASASSCSSGSCSSTTIRSLGSHSCSSARMRVAPVALAAGDHDRLRARTAAPSRLAIDSSYMPGGDQVLLGRVGERVPPDRDVGRGDPGRRGQPGPVRQLEVQQRLGRVNSFSCSPPQLGVVTASPSPGARPGGPGPGSSTRARRR